MRLRLKYKITVKTLQDRFLTYKVHNYETENGFIRFTDRITGKEKMFAIQNVEIEPMEDDNGF